MSCRHFQKTTVFHYMCCHNLPFILHRDRDEIIAARVERIAAKVNVSSPLFIVFPTRRSLARFECTTVPHAGSTDVNSPRRFRYSMNISHVNERRNVVLSFCALIRQRSWAAKPVAADATDGGQRRLAWRPDTAMPYSPRGLSPLWTMRQARILIRSFRASRQAVAFRATALFERCFC